MRRFASLLMSLSCLILVGCETPPRQGPRPAAGPARTAAPATPGAPIAAWRDRTVTFDDLRPALAELAGTTVLRDAFLDFRLEQALAERALTIDNAAVERERALLLRSLDASPDVAERLLQEIRAGQGLGPVRFAALLRRNAGLRALVQPDVRITQDALVRQFDVLYGPKRVSRIITVQTLREAVDIGQALDDGADFAELATRHSTDASAARGGLLAPLSKSDPAWPEPFRQALFALAPGATSAPTLIEDGYVIIRLIEDRPTIATSMESQRADVEAALRSAQERVLMEERARSFLSEIQPTFYDDTFGAAWRRAGL